MVNRKDYRPTSNRSSSISQKDRETIRGNKPQYKIEFTQEKTLFGKRYYVKDNKGKVVYKDTYSDNDKKSLRKQLKGINSGKQSNPY